MAIRGQRPKAPALRLIEGSRGAPSLPAPRDAARATGRPVAPKWLPAETRAVWREVLPKLTWLRAPDAYKLASWCDEEANYRDALCRSQWSVARLAEHRKAGSELGLDHVSRARMTEGHPGGGTDTGEDFFGGR